MIRITGKTYPHLTFLRSIGAQFHPSDKSWSVPSVTVDQLLAIWRWSDVTVYGCDITPEYNK